MKIGVPRELKNNENRVGLVPSGVRQLVSDGHELVVESMAGIGIGISDKDYRDAGATILPSLSEVYGYSEMIIKVKEPLKEELSLLRKGQILYTYLHLAADRELTEKLMNSGATAVAYETIQELDGTLPLLIPMSEVAGRMSTQVGASYLQLDKGGKGILLGGVPGVKRAKVTVIGCGIAGTNAIKMAMGLGADVTAIDVNPRRLAELDDLFENRITTLFSNLDNIDMAVTQSDLVIGAVLIPGARAPKLVTKEHLKKMEKGSVLVDIAVDQGGCIETCRPTTHENPTFIIDGMVHYCVANMPGAVANTSTYALTNVTLRYARMIAALGVEEACRQNLPLKWGVNTYRGDLVYRQVAVDHDLPHTELNFI